MARACSVCQHPDRAAIDAALAQGSASNRAVARQHGLSKDAVARHGETHLPERLTKAVAEADNRAALDVVKQLRAINGATLGVLNQARQRGDGGLTLRAVDRVQRQLELQAKLLGDLDDRPVTNVLVTSPEHIRARTAIMEALAPFPEARQAVAQSLLALDAE